MAAGPWTERLRELPRAVWRDLRGLRGDERLATVGVGLIAAAGLRARRD